MRYRCDDCETLQWRGLFPESPRHFRWAVAHGIALGFASVLTKSIFRLLDYEPRGLKGGLVTISVCGVLLLVIYGMVIIVEALTVALRGCNTCNSHNVSLAT
jgi:hypothetical protein